MYQPEKTFIARVRVALDDGELATALNTAEVGFVDKRQKAINAVGVDRFEAMRTRAQHTKQHAITRLPALLEQFTENAQTHGAQVHWAIDAAQSNQIITDILRNNNCTRIGKGKSMVAEEINLHQALDSMGVTTTETDLGEYIIQLAKEPPSHIIAPAIHKNRKQIHDLFIDHHRDFPKTRTLDKPQHFVREARKVLRQAFITNDAGIIGSNLLIAENGASMLVTNEGNGDLTATLPRILIVICGIEKVVATMQDAFSIVRVLARSATGQHISNYTSFYFGPKRQGEKEGPEQVHFVLVDNGRSNMIADGYAEILRCIRCGACLNHCPVYSAIGGHAYGWTYPGPIGSVVSPLLAGLPAYHELPDASTFCGRCEQVCPMRIPLPELLRKLRVDAYTKRISKFSTRLTTHLHSRLIATPKMYAKASWFVVKTLRLFSINGKLPKFLAPPSWRKTRITPAPQGVRFRDIAKNL